MVHREFHSEHFGLPQRRKRMWFLGALCRGNDLNHDDVLRRLESALQLATSLQFPSAKLEDLVLPPDDPRVHAELRSPKCVRPSRFEARGSKWQTMHRIWFLRQGVSVRAVENQQLLLRANPWYQALPARAQDCVVFGELMSERQAYSTVDVHPGTSLQESQSPSPPTHQLPPPPPHKPAPPPLCLCSADLALVFVFVCLFGFEFVDTFSMSISMSPLSRIWFGTAVVLI
jgi:hypothetical protein